MLFFAASPSRADQTDPRLPALFDLLKTSQSPAEASRVERDIWLIWFSSDQEIARQLLQQGVAALSQNNLRDALESFNSLVDKAPQFAEGWNKRATVRYLLGDFKGSLADIITTLELEPRHFGALAGRGLIYQALGDQALAFQAFQAALAVHPFIANARAFIRAYKNRGQPI